MVVSVEKYFFVAGLFLALVFAWLEPAGSSGFSVPGNMIFWLVQVTLVLSLLILIQTWVGKHFKTGPWTGTILSGVPGALLFTPVALGLDILPEIRKSMVY